MGEGYLQKSRLICPPEVQFKFIMQNMPKANNREAKIIHLSKNITVSPQIPEQPVSQGILQLHTLEFIDQLLDEHFK